jgi:hypothetical protein
MLKVQMGKRDTAQHTRLSSVQLRWDWELGGSRRKVGGKMPLQFAPTSTTSFPSRFIGSRLAFLSVSQLYPSQFPKVKAHRIEDARTKSGE